MRKLALTFRCASRSDRRELHTITVEGNSALCSCTGTEWCSHIEATLVDGERNMIPFEEWDTADQAQQLLAGSLIPPRSWKAHWREDRVWRGLAEPRKTNTQKAIQAGRPLICFIGEGQLGNRSDYIEEATGLGWTTVDNPSELVTLVVVSERASSTKRATLAKKLNLPMLLFHEWDEHAYDFTEKILEAIQECRPSEPPSPNRIAA